MNILGKWKRQILLCILGLGVLTIIAGSSAAVPVDPEPEQQALVAERHEAPNLPTLPNPVLLDVASVDPDSERQMLTVEPNDVSDLRPLLSTVAPSTTPVDPVPEAQVLVAEQYEASDLPYSLSAGTPTKAPVDPVPEGQLVAELSAAPDLQPLASDVVPTPQVPSLQQAKATTPAGEGEQELKATVNQQSETSTKGSDGGTKQTEYTWEDGDRSLTVILQSDLAIDEDASTKGAMADAPGGAIVKSAGAKGEGEGTSLPVFKSQSGALMTLPGGVVLVLDPDWSQAEVNAFFSSNGIKLDRVEGLGYIDNGYFIETEPGFPSLDLANGLAVLEGVMLSSPNWWTEVTVK